MRSEVETLKYARQTVGEDVNNAVKKLDKIEQYSRRNCLIFTRIKEDSDPRTDEVVNNICDTNLGLDITEDSIDRSHRLGRSYPFTSQSQIEFERPKPRTIIVKFLNYRSDVFRSKAKLKQTDIVIYENLTSRRLPLLNAATVECCQRNRWCKKCLVTRWKSFCIERWIKDPEHLQREL